MHMGAPPQLTAHERSAALAKAKESRQIRSAAKTKIKSGELTLSDIFTLAETDSVIGKMRVSDLLAALSGVGKIRATAIMERLSISPTRRIQGLGKSTIAAYIRKHGTFWVSVSSTTRQPRATEKDGVEYYFLTDEEFDQEIAKNHFLEWAHFAGARYGTPREPVEQGLSAGKNVLLEIDIEGAKQVKVQAP